MMTTSMTRRATRIKRFRAAMRNLPLRITGYAIILCVELFTAGGIVQSTSEVVRLFGVTIALAALEIGISFGAGILSFQGSMAIAEMKTDPRPEQRRRAFPARICSLLLLAIPVVFFANALALQAQRAQRAEYIASEAYQADREMAFDSMADSMARRDAIADLERANEVKTARIDATWFGALLAAMFVYGTLGWAGTALYCAAPETAAEARRREQAILDAQKEAKTAAANAKRQATVARKAKERERAEREERRAASRGTKVIPFNLPSRVS